MDHVSAFKYLHQEKDITTDSSQHSNHINNSQINKYKHLKPINPITQYLAKNIELSLS